MELTMYDTLLQLPLFQGLCKNDFTDILGKVKLHFSKNKAMEKIIKQGSPCNGLVFLLNGEIISETKDRDDLYTWCEYFNEPYVLEPYSLFGMNTNYISSYSAMTDVNIVSIEKKFILSELNKYDIFRLNYLNIISNRSQILQDRLLNNKTNSIEEKVINFFLYHAEKSTGKKLLKIKMEDFATLLNDTRLSVSKVLNELQEMGLLVLRRKEIEIPEISLLATYKSKI